MANDSASANTPASASPAVTSPTVALFQKAHAKMVTLQRVEDQLHTLLEQRKRLQDELRAVQAQINEEFERVVQDTDTASAQVMTEISDSVKAKRGGQDAIHMEVAEAV